eukprot:scaffold165250_cov20-Tisochrysis_lutea.AAC.1
MIVLLAPSDAPVGCAAEAITVEVELGRPHWPVCVCIIAGKRSGHCHILIRWHDLMPTHMPSPSLALLYTTSCYFMYFETAPEHICNATHLITCLNGYSIGTHVPNAHKLPHRACEYAWECIGQERAPSPLGCTPSTSSAFLPAQACKWPR